MGSLLTFFLLALVFILVSVSIILLAGRDKRQIAKGEFDSHRATTVECVIAYVLTLIFACLIVNAFLALNDLLSGHKVYLIGLFIGPIFYFPFALVFTGPPAFVLTKCFSARGRRGRINCMIGGFLAGMVPCVIMNISATLTYLSFASLLIFGVTGICSGFVYWWVRRGLIARRLRRIS